MHDFEEKTGQATFNEKVAIDLKEVRDGDKKSFILHMVDMWSRLTQSVIISERSPEKSLTLL